MQSRDWPAGGDQRSRAHQHANSHCISCSKWHISIAQPPFSVLRQCTQLSFGSLWPGICRSFAGGWLFGTGRLRRLGAGSLSSMTANCCMNFEVTAANNSTGMISSPKLKDQEGVYCCRVNEIQDNAFPIFSRAMRNSGTQQLPG